MPWFGRQRHQHLRYLPTVHQLREGEWEPHFQMGWGFPRLSAECVHEWKLGRFIQVQHQLYEWPVVERSGFSAGSGPRIFAPGIADQRTNRFELTSDRR